MFKYILLCIHSSCTRTKIASFGLGPMQEHECNFKLSRKLFRIYISFIIEFKKEVRIIAIKFNEIKKTNKAGYTYYTNIRL